MMEAFENGKQVEVLNDLIQINNDRIEGYKKALAEINEEGDADLAPLFHRMVNNSLDYNDSLERMVELFDEAPAEGTSGAGKLYRAWMGVKALFSANDRKTILGSCETGEDAALRAYDDALLQPGLSDEVRSLITSQKNEIYCSRDEMVSILNRHKEGNRRKQVFGS